MSLATRLAEYVRACFTGLWIESYEHDDALTEIARLCQQEHWQLISWDIDSGLGLNGAADEEHSAGADPLAAIRAVNAAADPAGTTLLVLVNFHRFMNSAEIVQALCRQVALGKQNRTFVVILSPIVQIPTELAKQIIVIEHPLPNRQQLRELAQSIATEPGELPDDEQLDHLLDAAAGLTRYEAEGAFSLSLVREGRLTAESLWELKSQALKQSGLLTLYRGDETFADLGGLTALKSFCLRAMRNGRQADPIKRPRGVMLLGVPGTGKSAFAKSLGHETDRPTLSLDVGSLMGSLVGETERNIRQALSIADAMAPAVLFIDEVEKGLSGASSSGQNDSGVTARLFSSFLTWLNDHESDVFVVCTCNDISRLPPEFARAQRFDAIFFLDLPGEEQQRAIWQLCLEQFDLNPTQPLPVSADWTGAEIHSCCRLAALLDVSVVEAADHIVPVAVTAAESVTRLRRWASHRCLDAERPGIFTSAPDRGNSRRKVSRDPSHN